MTSPHREKIIRLLQIKPMRPSEIATELNLSRPQVTRNLKELEHRNIIICLNPDVRKGRFYKITNNGEKIMELLAGGGLIFAPPGRNGSYTHGHKKIHIKKHGLWDWTL